MVFIQSLPHWLAIPLGMLLIVPFLFIQYQNNKQSFNRRNAAGLEEFDSFEDSIKTVFIEKAKYFIACVIALLGVLMLSMHVFQVLIN
jgi:hypothetical protein